MIYDRWLSEVSYTQKKVSDITNASRFPFYVKETGFLCDDSITFEESCGSDWVILYSLSGSAALSYKGARADVRRADIALLPLSGAAEFINGSDGKWEYLFAVFGGRHTDILSGITGSADSTDSGINIFTVDLPALIIGAFVRLLKLDYDDSDLSAVKASALINVIISAVYDISAKAQDTPTVFPDHYMLQVNTAVDYIRNNYAGDCSVDKICSYAGFSKYHFSRVFKDVTGVTIHRFVNRHRVNKAIELLSDTELTVSDIGTAVGFNDAETFSRVFKYMTGGTPGSYRERRKN